MKTNKTTGADSGSTVRDKINLKEAGGVYDHNPDPGLAEYGRSTGGPNELPIKFAEPDFLPTKRNQMTSSVMDRIGRTASKPTSSRINKKKNRYESAVKKGF